ncbi:flagellar basal-body MS-ring/collar protein FliF [Cognatishimia sp. SS12]|uniref:flagellar basal-body MS-ring/collar protein FliF n=1 Tax=Cognatishimia sp. SS12 TaxID=2979465 RepID=UPI00232C8437|nr:flagellar basal-body MS-ring/collar protein FliF [Cognatishimia sp. SS12]MDC0739418.1 flagellar basal-body MS-ring/collar protein FliF [Cognatishimia sp. SS12]
MQNVIQNLTDLGQKRLMILGGVGAGVMTALILGISAITTPDYAALYKNLSPATATSVEATLANAGFDARMSEDGATVMVPSNALARARMVLAETGIPIEGDPGWELFDEASGLAMNTFMQRVNRLRAMEGELARSIQTLEGVQSARVHLVLPEREAFSRERPNPRASIIVRPVPGRTISRKQASAIRNLVASSVAELELGRVTVLSASGEVILAEAGEGDTQVTLQSTKSSIEERLAQEVRNMLTARVGAGNARVRVNVELTTAREVVIEQSYNPDQQVVRSTESRAEEQAGTEGGGGGVGVENNIPAALQGDGTAAPSSSQSKSGETVQYEIGNTRREVVREAGEIKRISVAVLVNGIYNVEDGEVIYSDREAAEIQRLTELVKTSVGFNSGRGDNVSVDSLRFMDYSMEVGDPITLSMGEQLTRNIVPILRGLLGLMIVALVMILGVRPALRTLLEKPQSQLPPAGDAAAALAAPEGAASVGADKTPEVLPTLANQPMPDATGTNAAPLPDRDITRTKPSGLSFDPKAPGVTSIFELDEEDGPHEYIETLGVRGNLIKARVEAIQNMAEEKPDDVLRVLRTWLRSEADA